MVAELELVGFRAQRLGNDLVAQADAEQGHPALNQLPGRLRHVVQGTGIARAVAQEKAVGIHRQDLGRGGGGRHHLDPETLAGQAAQDVVLDAQVPSHNQGLAFHRDPFRRFPGSHRLPWGSGRLSPGVGCGAGHFAHQVPAFQPLEVPGPGLELFRVQGTVRAQGRVHHSLFADVPGQPPGVDVADAGHAGFGQPVWQGPRGPPAGHMAADFAHDQGRQAGTCAFDVILVDAGVADVGRGHADHLPLIGRIRDHLLVSGQAGVEHHLPHCHRLRAKPLAGEHGAVRQHQMGALPGHGTGSAIA